MVIISKKPKIALIMCVWHRFKNLKNTLILLNHQTYKNFDVYLWNNNPNIKKDVNTLIKSYNNTYVLHSNRDEGGFGRFLCAKKLVNDYQYFIFIDDDQVFDSYLIETFLSMSKPKSIYSWWSWRFDPNHLDYWNRKRVGHGEWAHYCGTGGMIIDHNIFRYDRLFKIPKRYYFIEDLWLSYIANHDLNYELYGISVNIDILMDHKDQSNNMIELKREFLDYLVKKLGWTLKGGFKNET
ncbi:MAG: glycosyltransferase family 2 protein [Candidatus Helarchaeota archaeon]